MQRRSVTQVEPSSSATLISQPGGSHGAALLDFWHARQGTLPLYTVSSLPKPWQLAHGASGIAVAAGVVVDSVPEHENMECANKAKALLAAVPGARRMTAQRRTARAETEETT